MLVEGNNCLPISYKLEFIFFLKKEKKGIHLFPSPWLYIEIQGFWDNKSLHQLTQQLAILGHLVPCHRSNKESQM